MTTPPTATGPLASLLLCVSAAAVAVAPRRKSPAAARWAGAGGSRRRRCRAAVVEEAGVLLPKEGDEEGEEAAAGRYDWREEWYPLYLSNEVPDDAALPLTVFDRQLVLWRDGNGVLRCHEDRCPHR